MPVTNFQSVISAQTVGTADVQALAASFDKLSGSIDGATQKANKVNEHPGFNAFAEKVRQGLENPLGAAGQMAESFLVKLGPVGAGVTGIASTLIAAGAASVSFMGQLGALGHGIEATGVRMGLTNREVQQFSFAMKYAGGDMGSLEAVMRKLSAEIDGGGTKLRAIGVNFQDVSTGKIRPMSDIILQLSERWKSMSIADTAKRDTEAVSLLGRGALGALPEIMELAEGLLKVKGRVLDEGDLAGFKQMHHQVAEIDRDWDFLVTKLKQGVVIPFRLMFPGDSPDPKGKFGSGNFPLDFDNSDGTNGMSPEFRAKYLAWKAKSTAGPTPEQLASIGRSDFAIDALLKGDPSRQLADAKKKLEALGDKIPRGVTEEASKSARDDYAQQAAVVKGIEARIAANKTLSKSIDDVIKSIEAQTKADDDYTAKLLKGGRLLYLNANGGAGVSNLSSLGDPLGASMKDFADSQFFQAIGGMFGNRGMTPPTRLQKDQSTLDWWEQMKAERAEQGKLAERDTADNERRGLSLYGAKASLGGVSEIDQINGLEALRKKYADDRYEALMMQGKEEEAIDQQHQKYLDAEIERQQALLQFAQRQKEEFQSLAVGFLDAGRSGGGAGLQRFMMGQLNRLEDTAVSHLSGAVWGGPTKGTGISGPLSKIIPAGGPLDKLFGLGVAGGDPLKSAGVTLIQAGRDLSAAARALAASRSGGGIGGGRVTGTGGGVGYPSNDPYGWMSGTSGPSDYDPANPDAITPEGAAWGDNFWASNPTGGGMSSLAKYAGIGGTLAAGGFGLYSGIKARGTQGDLTAVGSGLGMAGGIVSMLIPKLASTLGPIGMALGMGLGLVSTLLGDPKQNRAKSLSTQAQERQFTMPTGADYELSSSGGYEDYNYRGQSRSTVVYQIYAMDSKSFNDYLIANPAALSNGMTSAIAGGNADDVVTSIAARVNP
jgi:hypothetical protein